MNLNELKLSHSTDWEKKKKREATETLTKQTETNSSKNLYDLN